MADDDITDIETDDELGEDESDDELSDDGPDLDLDGRIASRIEHLPSVDVDDRSHVRSLPRRIAS